MLTLAVPGGRITEGGRPDRGLVEPGRSITFVEIPVVIRTLLQGGVLNVVSSCCLATRKG